MDTGSHRSLAAATVALVTVMGLHVLRSSLAMVVWNIAEDRPEGVLALVALGIWLAGLLGWVFASRLHRPRVGMAVAAASAAVYAAQHFFRHPALTPALAAISQVLWLWMVPALLGLLARVDALDVLAPGILVGLSAQVALQTALHGLDVPVLYGLLPGLGAALLGATLTAAWRSTESTAPPATGVLSVPGWGLFALGPYLVLQLTLLANVGRVQMITGWDIERASVLIVLGLAGGAAAMTFASSVAVRAATAPAMVFLAGASLILAHAAWLAVLQVLAAVALAGVIAPAPLRRPLRGYVWGALGMLFALGLIFLFYSRYEWVELWPIIAAVVALSSLARPARVISSSTFRTVLAIILAGAVGLALSRLTQRPPGPAARAPSDIRVLTYNMHMGFTASGIPDAAAIARVIDAADADIIALQEVGRGWTVNGGADLAAWLHWRFPQYRLVYGPMNGALWGNVILSRSGVLDSGWVRFPLRAARFRRGLTWATIPAAGGELLVVNVHFAHGPADDERLAQAGDVLAFLADRSPALILGDLNAAPDSAAIRRLAEAGLNDVLAPHGLAGAFTFPAARPAERRDYIFTTQDIRSLAAAVTQTTASDHLPVVAQIRVR